MFTMDEMTDREVILKSIDIIVDLIRDKHLDYEDVRKINYTINLARSEDIKKLTETIHLFSMKTIAKYADIVTRVFRDDESFLENEPYRLDEIFITKRKTRTLKAKTERAISICNCAYLALYAPDNYKKTYEKLYHITMNKYD